MNERNFEIFQYLNDKVVEEQEQEEEGQVLGIKYSGWKLARSPKYILPPPDLHPF